MLNIFVKSIFRGEEEPKAKAPGVLRRLSLVGREGWHGWKDWGTVERGDSGGKEWEW